MSVPLLGKTVPANTRVLQRGLSSSSFIGLMRVVVLKGGEIDEEVRSMGKGNRGNKRDSKF
jgi:hypothetical protein